MLFLAKLIDKPSYLVVSAWMTACAFSEMTKRHEGVVRKA